MDAEGLSGRCALVYRGVVSGEWYSTPSGAVYHTPCSLAVRRRNPPPNRALPALFAKSSPQMELDELFRGLSTVANFVRLNWTPFHASVQMGQAAMAAFPPWSPLSTISPSSRLSPHRRRPRWPAVRGGGESPSRFIIGFSLQIMQIWDPPAPSSLSHRWSPEPR